MTASKILGATLLLFFLAAGLAGAEGPAERLPPRWGLSLTNATSFSPKFGVEFSTISYLRDWDHGYIWHNDGPPELRFRTELTMGLARIPELRFLGTGNIMAVRYLDFLSGPMFRPYLEGGVGLIYTDFRVHGQGLRFNFDPQFGLGVEMKASPDVDVFLESRWHHISNAGLNDENRGINSVLVTFGVLFR